MKTRLLFLFLMVFSFGNAQPPTIPSLSHQNVTSTSATINFQVQNNCLTYSYRAELATNGSFSASFMTSTQIANNYCSVSPISHSADFTGLLPNTTYYYRARVQISSNLYYSTVGSFTTAGLTPVFGPTSSIPAVSTAIVNYSLIAGVGSSAITIFWGTSAGAMTNSLANGTILNSGSGNGTITGLSPATVYFYVVEAVNSNGTVYSTTGTFTTLPAPPAGTEFGLLKEFKFDGDSYDTTNSVQFVSSDGSNPIAYGLDRFNVSSKSLITTAAAFRQCTIPGIPIGNTDRTISIWYKVNAISAATYPGPFAYGGASTYNTFGYYINSINAFFQGYAYDQSFSNTTVAGVWYHAVVIFQAGVAKIYVNGILKGEISRPLLNTNNTFFRIGNFNGFVDDLKIYDRAISASEITNLYNSGTTLSSSNFSQNNLEVKLYPNPVRDILNIEIENDIQSIEIYNIQGQKVLSSNQKQINVSDLATGMYMVRIQDIDDNIATKKIVIK